MDLTGACDVTAGRACRYCHCTDDRACQGGCAWVAPDVCSNPDCVKQAYLDCALTPDLGQSLEDPIEPLSDAEYGGL